MRHGKRFNKLGRTSAHRSALMSNMAVSLLRHKRIWTTVAKAKALRGYVEPLITRARTDTTHARRMVFARLRDKEVMGMLFGPIRARVGDRPGGYTRIIRIGRRLGDQAERCLMELVDFNHLYGNTSAQATDEKETTATPADPKRKRTRRGGSSSAATKKSTSPSPQKTTAQAKPNPTTKPSSTPKPTQKATLDKDTKKPTSE